MSVKEKIQVKLEKFSGNPILEPRRGSSWEGAQVRNPAVFKFGGKIHMLYTATGDIDIEHKVFLGHAVSDDGVNFTRTSEKPAIAPSDITDGEKFDSGCVEDARAIVIDDTVYITYGARAVPHWSFACGMRVSNPPTQGATWTENYRRGGLITTTDMRNFARRGPITGDDQFDCNIILFPEKIGGRYAMLHRPTSILNGADGGISICFSDDLINWNDDKPLANGKYSWEDGKIGGGCPPIRTEAGWLLIYHSVQKAPQNSQNRRIPDWHFSFPFCYRAGMMLLDLDDPTKIISRHPEPILEPETPFEKFGIVNNVVFPTGCVRRGKELFIYYGAADTVICLAKANIDQLLDQLINIDRFAE